MSWLTIVRLLVVWYLTVQLVSFAVLPLTLRVLRALPDRGISFAKISGILLVGVVYWLGFSYGLLRNERGGVWVALIATAAVAWLVGWADVKAWWLALRQGGRLRAWLVGEAIFVVAFVGWAIVRAYDPNVDHTEQPMDLMFINSLWSSAAYPPQDAWLAGYAISYYYLGYWLLTALARVANSAPQVAYNVGQAVWYGLLWSGCFGLAMNLLAWRFGRTADGAANAHPTIPVISLVGGVLSGMVVALMGNLQVILEWLYAQGVNIDRIARWVDVYNFPENATRTGAWFIDYGWWWWRSSRVIEDIDLLGRHVEVIDEFPMFSYLLGDNHPHVLAMPVVLLVVAMAFNLLLLMDARDNSPTAHAEETSHRLSIAWLPLRPVEIGVYLIALGSLVFLNTWDFPPYWLLMVAVVLVGSGGRWGRALAVGGVAIVATIALYVPYFLSAQSQAGGVIPNVVNPTRLPQFLLMWGAMLPAIGGVLMLGWRAVRPTWSMIGWSAALVLGGPLVLIGASALLASTPGGEGIVARMEAPENVTSYSALILERWVREPWTLLLVGALLTLALAWGFALLAKQGVRHEVALDLVFVMMMSAIGLALIYAPEIVFLRDFFGTRMNTVFKFYYQGWLLLGVSSAYLIVVALAEVRQRFGALQVLAMLALLLMAGSLIYPVAGIYAKAGGFQRAMPTLDATAYVALNSPDVMAAAEWVRANTTPDQRVLEGVGGSYSAHHNRMSTMTGRPTLLGWEGHERQWRGQAYGAMSQGREEAIEMIYRTAPAKDINALLAQWEIDYVYIGPVEIEMYGITPFRLEELASAMDTVFERGQVRVLRHRAE